MNPKDMWQKGTEPEQARMIHSRAFTKLGMKEKGVCKSATVFFFSITYHYCHVI